jgi:hypothetical protein
MKTSAYYNTVRSIFTTEGIEGEVEVFLANCREILLTADEGMAQEDRPHLIQAMISLAMQRLIHWAHTHSDEAGDPDMIPTQAFVGAFGGLGFALAMMEYDPEEVLSRCLPVLARAWGECSTALAMEAAAPEPVRPN